MPTSPWHSHYRMPRQDPQLDRAVDVLSRRLALGDDAERRRKFRLTLIKPFLVLMLFSIALMGWH